MAILGLILLIAVICLLFIGPTLSGKDYQFIDAWIKNTPPNSEYWFGTEDMGRRPQWTRVCVGGWTSFHLYWSVLYFGNVCKSAPLLGALAGLKGGIVDDLIMRFCELIGNLPYLIIVIILSLVMGRSMFSLVFAMSLTAWVATTRMVRGQILQIKEQDYVQAAKALGADTGRILIKHLLPNTLGII